MKQNRLVVPFSFLLLILCIVLSIYGKHQSKMQDNVESTPVEVENNSSYFDKEGDNIVFYSSDNEKIAEYKCNDLNCDFASPVIDDNKLQHFESTEVGIGISDFNTAFIQDGDELVLFSLDDNKSVGQYSQYKNYGYLKKNVILTDMESKKGIFDLENLEYIVEPEYEFLGISKANSSKDENSIQYAALNDNKWFIINSKNKKISEEFDFPIYDYNDEYIYLLNEDLYDIRKYDGTPLLNNELITKTETGEIYTIITTEENNIYIYDSDLKNKYFEMMDNGREIHYELQGKNVIFYDKDSKQIDSFTLNN